jgi:Nose resistant-to-fluoxetine protein, N-terminal domain
VFDSSSKIPADGILDGTSLTQVGNYDQCLATLGPKDADGVLKFKGKYCIFRPGFQGFQIEMMNETIAASLEAQTTIHHMLVSFLKKSASFTSLIDYNSTKLDFFN